MNRDETRKYYAEYKKFNPDGYRQQVRCEYVEVAEILLQLFVFVLFGICLFLGKTCWWLVETLISAAKADIKKTKKLDEQVFFGEDMTGFCHNFK